MHQSAHFESNFTPFFDFINCVFRFKNRDQCPFPNVGWLLSVARVRKAKQWFCFHAITLDSWEVPLMIEFARASPCLQDIGTLIFSSWPINSTRYGSISSIGDVLPLMPPWCFPLFTLERMHSGSIIMSSGTECFSLHSRMMEVSSPFLALLFRDLARLRDSLYLSAASSEASFIWCSKSWDCFFVVPFGLPGCFWLVWSNEGVISLFSDAEAVLLLLALWLSVIVGVVVVLSKLSTSRLVVTSLKSSPLFSFLRWFLSYPYLTKGRNLYILQQAGK